MPSNLTNRSAVIITERECLGIITQMRFAAESSLFGHKKDESFAGSLGAIYQSFNGSNMYPSLEEKAAGLLYFITKNHSFTDGNKRIATAMFLYFLYRNDVMPSKLVAKLDEKTLTALVIMIAESHRNEKEMMIMLILKFLTQ